MVSFQIKTQYYISIIVFLQSCHVLASQKYLCLPTTKRELLDQLQMRAAVFRDRIGVKVIFPVELIGN